MGRVTPSNFGLRGVDRHFVFGIGIGNTWMENWRAECGP